MHTLTMNLVGTLGDDTFRVRITDANDNRAFVFFEAGPGGLVAAVESDASLLSGIANNMHLLSYVTRIIAENCTETYTDAFTDGGIMFTV